MRISGLRKSASGSFPLFFSFLMRLSLIIFYSSNSLPKHLLHFNSFMAPSYELYIISYIILDTFLLTAFPIFNSCCLKGLILPLLLSLTIPIFFSVYGCIAEKVVLDGGIFYSSIIYDICIIFYVIFLCTYFSICFWLINSTICLIYSETTSLPIFLP